MVVAIKNELVEIEIEITENLAINSKPNCVSSCIIANAIAMKINRATWVSVAIPHFSFKLKDNFYEIKDYASPETKEQIAKIIETFDECILSYFLSHIPLPQKLKIKVPAWAAREEEKNSD